MPTTVTAAGQTSWKNSYASSAQLRMTLRVNGEEQAILMFPDGTSIKAGFDAPTSAPTVTVGGAGVVPAGAYHYVYVYASSRYPFVQSSQSAGGNDWPRSSPSDSDTATSVGSQISVQCSTTTRSDVDYILIYRTAAGLSVAQALAEAEAGRYYYVGNVANDPISPTATYVDNNAADTGEALELDNFPCPAFRYTVFDGTYFWGWGNIPLVLPVTLDGTDTITLDEEDGEWFNGRDGQTATLSGVTTGGYDQRGSFYFKWVSATECQLCTDPELENPATVPFTGETVITIGGAATTLYRSKALNPFSWGRTTEIISADGTSSILVPDMFAEPVGGGVGSAIALIPNERILKLDTERPARSYALDLNAASESNFMETLRTLDEAQSVSSHFSQFPMRLPNSQSVSTGINAKAYRIISADSSSQVPIGDQVIRTLRNIQNDDDAPEFFHGVFDYTRELNCWWVKTGVSQWYCDTLIYQHAPTGKWGIKYSPGISASCTVYDYETRDYYTFVGDEAGRIGKAFAEDVFKDFSDPNITETGTLSYSAGEEVTLRLPSALNLTGIPIEVVNGFAKHILFETFVDRVYYATGTTFNASVRIFENSDGDFGFATNVADGTYEGSFFLVEDYTTLPCTLVYTTGDSQVATQRRYVSTYFDTIGFLEFANNLVVMRVQPASEDVTARGFNIDTGEHEQIAGGDYTVWVGATLCTAGRYFTASSPEKPKRNTEIWLTQQNGSPVARYNFEYGSLITAAVTLAQDVTNGNNSYRWKAFSPTALIMPSFGVDIHEVSYAAYSLSDFTIKLGNS